MTLTSTNAASVGPLSSPPGAPLVQTASLSTSNLQLTNLADARTKLTQLGINGNLLTTCSTHSPRSTALVVSKNVTYSTHSYTDR